MRKSESLEGVELFVYYVACIFTFGTVWLTKIIIKKAINESRLK
jgi:hypothetical protein